MNRLKKGSYTDFYFNGMWLSDMGGYVGSTDGGFTTYSLLPSRSYVTEKPLGSNKTMVFASSLEPRVITIPVVFGELDEYGLRGIAAWLDTPEPSQLYFDDEEMAIDCVLDSQAFDIETFEGINGMVELKFIANDPIYYSLKENKTTLTSIESGKEYEIISSSTYEVFPTVKVGCTGKLKMSIYQYGKLYSECNISDIPSGVIINCETLECSSLSGASLFDKIDTFPKFPSGDFSIVFTCSSINNATISFREQYI